jgi:hypothetical protein
MRLVLLIVTTMALASTGLAQEPVASPPVAGQPSAADSAGATLPVSLDRIREGLKQASDSRLKNLDVKPDFTIQIEEQRHIDEIMSKLDFKSGPAPAGGLYAYEQQRQLFKPSSRPLQQPYAAYSGGEFFTIAIENLLRVYLGDKLKNGLATRARARDEAGAREEVDQAIAEYCASRPDRADIQLCLDPPVR